MAEGTGGEMMGLRTLTRREVLTLMVAGAVGARPDAQVGPRSARRVIAGDGHTMLLEPDGTLRTYTSLTVGRNQGGVFGLGHNNPVASDVWIRVPGLSGVVNAAGGSDCSFAVRADGQLLAWGSRASGMLGISTPAEVQTDLMPLHDAFSPTPVAVQFDATDVCTGAEHVLGLGRNGSVYAWGNGLNGRLGIGALPMIQVRGAARELRTVTYPVRLPGLSGITTIAAGQEHSLAVGSDGRVWTWGRNHRGQLADSTTQDRTEPIVVSGVRSPAAIAAGGALSAALLADGTVMTWGQSDLGGLGRPGTAPSVPALVPGVTNATAITVGSDHMLALLKDGTVMAWGSHTVGELGLGDGARGGPTPRPIKWITHVARIVTRRRLNYAVLEDGAIRIWGSGVPLFGRPQGHPDISPYPIELLVEVG